ncbi:MAG: extracellular solute-binding protein [Planctomycetota bacterium]
MTSADRSWTRRQILKAGAALPFAGCAARGSGDASRLEFWTLSLKPFEDYIRRMLASFESANPGVTVEWVDVPFDAIERKLVAATAAGQSPDVVNMSDLTFARFASLGAFADHDPLLASPAEETYIPGALSVCRIDGALRALPWYLTTQSVLANESILRIAELDARQLPTRWNDLLDLAERVRLESGTFLFSHPLGRESQLPAMLLADGIELFRLDESGKLRATLATPEVSAMLSRWIRAFEAGLVPRESATKGHAHLIEGYQSGRLGLINTGPNFLGRIRDVAPSVFDATAVRPAVTGALGRPHISVMVLGVMARSRKQELAARLASHMTSAEAQLEFCRVVNILPSTPTSLADPLFDPPSRTDDAESKIALARSSAAEALPNAVAFTPAVAAWPDMRKVFEDRITRVLLGTSDLEDTLVDIESNWNQLLVATGGGHLDAIPRPQPFGMDA